MMREWEEIGDSETREGGRRAAMRTREESSDAMGAREEIGDDEEIDGGKQRQ
ncbi:UNVERIFIED_CONTAM: hypothetical protein Sradi_4530300 [Sesamum radiatum]|uniref:Uncharacterized protein n=1 Tax=Sesamum radiatum TaxID=300843 RepID=A0AAW2NB20_SESRA